MPNLVGFSISMDFYLLNSYEFVFGPHNLGYTNICKVVVLNVSKS